MNKSLLIGIFFSLALSFMTQQLYACPTTPTAKIISPDDPHYVLEGDSVSFDGKGSETEVPPTGSFDGDNKEPYGGGHGIDKYEWHYGDEGPSDPYWNDDGGTPSHTYNDAGEYNVYLKVTDDDDPPQTDTTDSSESIKIYVMKVEIYEPEDSEFPKYIGIDTSLTLKAKITPSSATGGVFNWSKVSGPGTATFGPSNASTTSFSADEVGSYTVKVTYTIEGVTCSDTAGTIEVCNAKMIFKAGTPPTETSSLTRTESGTFEILNADGDPIPDATYSNWTFDGELDAWDPGNTSNTWSGTIVQSGGASCIVTFDETTCEVNKSITVNARSGWSINPDCAQDNIDGWVNPSDSHGGFPGITNITMGRCRNRHDQSTAVFWPRGSNFENAYTTAGISSGPNKNLWYIDSSTLKIEWETVINKYAKSGTTPPNPPGTNFYEFNNGKGVDAAAFLQALKNHEYKGSGGNGEGHFAYLEEEESEPGNDAETEIEDNVGLSDFLLKTSTGTEIILIELDIIAANHEPPDGSNWSGNIHRYSFSTSVWHESYQEL